MYLYHCYVTGTWWQCDNPVPVVNEASISLPWNPDSESITVSTNYRRATWEVHFFDKDGKNAGLVEMRLQKQPIYNIDVCDYYTPFSVSLPTETEKTWTITYNYTDKRVVYYCNGVQVLNFALSDSVCTEMNNWRTFWDRKPTQIKLYVTSEEPESYCMSSNTGKYNGVIDSGEFTKTGG